MSRIMALGILMAASGVCAEPISLKTKDGREVRGELARVAPEGLVVTMADGVRRINWSELPEDVAAKYRGTAAEAEASELQRLRAEVERLRAENQRLRLQGGMAAGYVPSASVSPPPDPDEPTPAQLRIERIERVELPQARERLTKAEDRHAALISNDDKASRAKRLLEMRRAKEDLEALEKELESLRR